MMFPCLGHGIGLRPPHFAELLQGHPGPGWFEAISENYMGAGGNPRRVLREIRARFPVVLHGVSMSLGSTDPLDTRYLDALAQLIEEIEPSWVSDHLCWSSFGGHTVHDLWPLPYTEEALEHVSGRILRVQDRLGRRILIENVSSYLAFADSTLGEAEFLAGVAERADCAILLDVNNVYVSAHNNGFDAAGYLEKLPARRIAQIHLAGHSDEGTHLVDTHDHAVCDEVWALYESALRRFGRVSTLVEWDDNIPPLERVLRESRRAQAIERKVFPGEARAV